MAFNHESHETWVKTTTNANECNVKSLGNKPCLKYVGCEQFHYYFHNSKKSNQKINENDIQNNSYGHKMKVRRDNFGSGLCKMGLNKHSLAQGFEYGMFL